MQLQFWAAQRASSRQTREDGKIKENNDIHLLLSFGITQTYERIAAKSDCKVKNVSSRVLVHVGQSVADMKRELSKVQKHKLTSPMGWII